MPDVRPADDDHPYGERSLRFDPDPDKVKGRDVWDLQIKLLAWGSGTDNDGIGIVMDPVRLTGKYDQTTRDAVMRFQKAHKLPITGIVDGTMFRAIDAEAALHPVLIRDMRCPCVLGKNDGPIRCRCEKHKDKAGTTDLTKCDTGFGKKNFEDSFLIDDKTIWGGKDDGSDLALKDDANEKLDVYDMEEYEGMDKAVLWAVRGLLHRADIQNHDTPTPKYNRIVVTSGYRCWFDNYHHADDARWRHRRTTFHFGKSIEFYVDGHCTEKKWDKDKDNCPQCVEIQKVAREKCGFQLRWHQPGRPCVAEASKTARPPTAPFMVHVDTVRLHPRKDDKKLEHKDVSVFVQTDEDAIKPLYQGKVPGLSFPLTLSGGDSADPTESRWNLDPRLAVSEPYFRNTETADGGWFPVGRSRIWHGGIHLYPTGGAGTPVRAIADGEIVGCRLGNTDPPKNGSFNFVLIRHKLETTVEAWSKDAPGKDWKDKEFYSLYMHLDVAKADAASEFPWRKKLFAMTKKHLAVTQPAPIFEKKKDGPQPTDPFRLFAKQGYEAGDIRPVKADPVRAKTLDDLYPDEDKFLAVELDGFTDHFFFTKRENKVFGEVRAAVADLETKLDTGAVVGLEKPIKVYAGEVIGKVGPVATDEPVKGLRAFLHLETFSATNFSSQGFNTTVIDIAKDDLADRKKLVKKLVNDKLIPEPPNGVLFDTELKDLYAMPPYYVGLRSVVVKMPSAWSTSVDWVDVLKKPDSLGFLGDKADVLGTEWKKYQWWEEVGSKHTDLPAPAAIHHYHPITLLLQLAASTAQF